MGPTRRPVSRNLNNRSRLSRRRNTTPREGIADQARLGELRKQPASPPGITAGVHRPRSSDRPVRLSAAFIAAPATSNVPAYHLAHAVGMSPAWLSRKRRGRRRIRPEDMGLLIGIGHRLGLRPESIFVRFHAG